MTAVKSTSKGKPQVAGEPEQSVAAENGKSLRELTEEAADRVRLMGHYLTVMSNLAEGDGRPTTGFVGLRPESLSVVLADLAGRCMQIEDDMVTYAASSQND